MKEKKYTNTFLLKGGENKMKPHKVCCNKTQRRAFDKRGSIQKENTPLINIYSSNIGVPKCIKQILTDKKGENDNNTVIVRNFTTSTYMEKTDQPDRKSIRKEWP